MSLFDLFADHPDLEPENSVKPEVSAGSTKNPEISMPPPTDLLNSTTEQDEAAIAAAVGPALVNDTSTTGEQDSQQTLTGHQEPQLVPPDGGSAIAVHDASLPGASGSGAEPDSALLADVAYVERFLEAHGIVIDSAGRPRRPGDTFVAKSREDVSKALSHVHTTWEWLLDELLMQVRQAGDNLSDSAAKRALRHVERDHRAKRKSVIMDPLFEPLTDEGAFAAGLSWDRLCETCFDGDPVVVKRILQHYIYQVKQKARNEAVSYHLMPVIFSAIQGCGKTYFTKRFLEPLQELCPAPVLFTELADARSSEVFSFPVLLVDDMERLRPEQVPRLKAIVTNADMTRRRLGTSSVRQSRQCATLIGTSNEPIERLVPDDTGHRRFVTLHFRNGNPNKDGDAKVWEAVESSDFTMLWRSVDTFAPAPINPVLAELAAVQEANSLERLAADWLLNLDFNSEVVRNISVGRRIQVTDLFELFVDQTEHEVAIQAFGRVMRHVVQDAASPLDKARRNKNHRYYPVKKGVCDGLV